MPLRAEIRRVQSLPDDVPRKMLSLLRRYFANVRTGAFSRDLAEKDRVILLYDVQDRLAGFTTLQFIRLTVEGVRCVFLFSGDTIVDIRARTQSTLAGAFGHMLARMMDRHPDDPRYWFLISKGWRTYRFLPVFFNAFHPSWAPPADARSADAILKRRNAVAVHKFGGAFRADSGIIDWNGRRERLRPCHCITGTEKMKDPHVAYFLQKNPGWREGTELACIAEVSRENLNPKAWRIIQRTRVAWDDDATP
jgi:hypothetical protein